MAGSEAHIERTTEAFESLSQRGKEWVLPEDVALKAMIREQTERRSKRSRGLNTIRDLLALDEIPKKPSWRYRRQTSAALTAMEAAGVVQSQEVSSSPVLDIEDPLKPEGKTCVVYRLRPAEAGEAAADPVLPVERDATSGEVPASRRFDEPAGPYVM